MSRTRYQEISIRFLYFEGVAIMSPYKASGILFALLFLLPCECLGDPLREAIVCTPITEEWLIEQQLAERKLSERIPKMTIDELVSCISLFPDPLHTGITPAAIELENRGDRINPQLVEYLASPDGGIRCSVQQVLVAITLVTFSKKDGGFREEEWRAFWRRLGDYKWNMPVEDRKRAVQLWRREFPLPLEGEAKVFAPRSLAEEDDINWSCPSCPSRGEETGKKRGRVQLLTDASFCSRSGEDQRHF